MPKSTNKDSQRNLTFPGFEPPSSNFFRMPNNWTDITADMKSMAEMKVVEYILRHTWGYQEYGIMKRITIDEFMYGRRRQDGSRLDKGTGLSEQSVRNGLESALADGLIQEEIDDSDKARVKKYYCLRMQHDQLEGGVKDLDLGAQSLGSGVKDLDPEVQTLDPRGIEFRPRTEKDTLETHLKKEINPTYIRKAKTEGKKGDNPKALQRPGELSQTQTDDQHSKRKKTPQGQLQTTRQGDYEYDEIVIEEPEDISEDTLRNQRNTRKTQSPNHSAALTGGDTTQSSKKGFVKISDLLGSAAQAQHDSEIRQIIMRFVSDFADELQDQGPFSSSVTRAYNDLMNSNVSLDTFIQLMYEARSITQHNTASIKAKGERGGKAKMGYWFGVLEKKLGLKPNEHVARGD